jgi:hypothetical protein
MGSRKPEEQKRKPTRKKLKLSKETLKDLTDDKETVKGGLAACSGDMTGCAKCPSGMNCSY